MTSAICRLSLTSVTKRLKLSRGFHGNYLMPAGAFCVFSLTTKFEGDSAKGRTSF